MPTKRPGYQQGFKTAPFIAVLFIGLIMFNILSDLANGPPPPEPEATAIAPPMQADSSYAASPIRNDWPRLHEAPPAQANLARTNYYLLVDGSGSMQQQNCSAGVPKIQAAVTALNNFIDSVPSDANLGMAAFDRSGLSERVPLGSAQHDVIRQRLGQVEAYNATPLRSAISLGYRRLTEQARRQLGYGEYHLVIVTDGHADPASEDPSGIVQKILDESPVLVHVIGFCIGKNHILNQPGRTLYRAADNPQQLRQVLADVLAESPDFDLTRFPDR